MDPLIVDNLRKVATYEYKLGKTQMVIGALKLKLCDCHDAAERKILEDKIEDCERCKAFLIIRLHPRTFLSSLPEEVQVDILKNRLESEELNKLEKADSLFLKCWLRARK